VDIPISLCVQVHESKGLRRLSTLVGKYNKIAKINVKNLTI